VRRCACCPAPTSFVASKGRGGGIFVAATTEEGIGLSLSESVASMLATDAVDLDELLQTRMLVEVLLAGVAAQRATEQDVSEMRALLDEAQATLPDTQRFGELDRALHRRITQTAGNRLSTAFMEWVLDVLHPLLEERRKPAIVEPTLLEQHRNVVNAIELGDPAAAELTMHEHLVYLRDLLSVVDGLDDDQSRAE
jgi:GntR family transcriptional repressor for pyruvate dehydrogenase complex